MINFSGSKIILGCQLTWEDAEVITKGSTVGYGLPFDSNESIQLCTFSRRCTPLCRRL